MTSDQEVDHLLAETVRRFGAVLPQDRFSVYLTGSFASGDGSWLSDVDVAIIWELDRARPWELVLLGNVSRELVRISEGRLDPMVLQLDQLSEPYSQVMMPELVKAGVLMAGADVLSGRKLPDVQVQAVQLARRACTLIRRIHGTPNKLEHVDYPNPATAFYGYETKRVWYPKGIQQGTKEMIDVAAACAAACATAVTGTHVLGKADAVARYVAAEDLPWSDFVLKLYQRCHIDWQDQIPNMAEERTELRSLCEKLLAFENYFLSQYHCG